MFHGRLLGHLKRFDPDLARRLLGNVIISAAGRARDGELTAYDMTSWIRRMTTGR